jgi:hypothetical protein
VCRDRDRGQQEGGLSPGLLQFDGLVPHFLVRVVLARDSEKPWWDGCLRRLRSNYQRVALSGTDYFFSFDGS